MSSDLSSIVGSSWSLLVPVVSCPFGQIFFVTLLSDIHEGNTKIILGLIWMLILRFQIEGGGGGGQQDLLDWCNSVLNPQVNNPPSCFELMPGC
jgi:hypothetical protein